MASRPDTQRAKVAVLEPLLIAAGLTLVVSVRGSVSIWHVEPGLLALGVLTSAAYLVGYVAHRRSRARGPLRALLITVIVSQPLVLALWALDLGVSRLILAGELVLLFFFVALAGTGIPSRLRALGAVVFTGLAAYPTLAGVTSAEAEERGARPTDDRYVFTSYVDLSVTTYNVMENEEQDGGALALLPDGRVLVVAGSGDSRLLDFSDGLEATPVELGLPLDVAAYRARPRSEAQFYRVTDVAYRDGRLFAAYTHWDPEDDCYTLRLSEAAFEGSAVGDWTTRFESRPCVRMDYLDNETGGRIAFLDASHLLLTTGTLTIEYRGYDKWRKKSDYGRILEFDTDTWSYETFSVGHRNPQGLLVSGDHIWSTEHGPHGGDELNLIERGSDYGWPYVSYGTDYGRKTLALGGTPGDHTGFAEPVYAWLPSVGVSNLIKVSGTLFPTWQGDLLIGSLTGLGNGRAIFRVRLLDDRPMTVERIPTESRVRDLLELPDGPLLLWDGRGSIRVLRPADHVFSPCTGCHVVRNAQHGIGPDLWGVVESPVARQQGFEYSDALKRYGGTWTSARLDRFLADPQAEVPGTFMEYEGVPDAAARAEIIRFLRDVSAGRP